MILSAVSLFLWITGALCNAGSHIVQIHDISIINGWADRGLALLLYVGVAFLLNSFVILENRTPWLAGLFLLFTSVLFPVQNILVSFSALLFIFSLFVLFSCRQGEDVRRRVYASFLLLAASMLLFPQFLYLLPLFLCYMAMSGALSVKAFLAALLGLITPFWMLYGAEFLFPFFAVVTNRLEQDFMQMLALRLVFEWRSDILLFLLSELFVMFPAVWFLFTSSNPSKPAMRCMFTFFVLLNFYLWSLSWFRSADFMTFLVWRLPGLALMAAYIFTIKINKLSNICFVLINILWLATAALGIWNG